MNTKQEQRLKLGCVILASGEGKRFGSNKLMAAFDGKPMIAHVLDALPSVLEPVVVTRSADVQRLAERYGMLCVRHELPNVCDTVRLGLEWLYQSDGCLFCVGDQPLLTRGTIERLLAAFEAQPDRIVRAAFGERVGNPVLFPQALYAELASLAPNETGGAVIRRHSDLVTTVQSSFAEELCDIDTPEALKNLEDFARQRR